jgi:hypothetical protein
MEAARHIVALLSEGVRGGGGGGSTHATGTFARKRLPPRTPRRRPHCWTRWCSCWRAATPRSRELCAAPRPPPTRSTPCARVWRRARMRGSWRVVRGQGQARALLVAPSRGAHQPRRAPPLPRCASGRGGGGRRGGGAAGRGRRCGSGCVAGQREGRTAGCCARRRRWCARAWGAAWRYTTGAVRSSARRRASTCSPHARVSVSTRPRVLSGSQGELGSSRGEGDRTTQCGATQQLIPSSRTNSGTP